VDCGVSRCLACGIGDLLLVEDTDSDDDDSHENKHEQRKRESKLDKGLSSR
jgi:hypothetical protein